MKTIKLGHRLEDESFPLPWHMIAAAILSLEGDSTPHGHLKDYRDLIQS